MKQKHQIKMLKDAKGCSDGIKSHHYKEGEVHEVSKVLATNFVHMGVAEHCVGEKMKEPHEKKAMTSDDYQNKSEKPNRRERR